VPVFVAARLFWQQDLTVVYRISKSVASFFLLSSVCTSLDDGWNPSLGSSLACWFVDAELIDPHNEGKPVQAF
jgi:hypothetical protein